MTYSDFVEKLKIGLYQESERNLDVIPFTAVVEKYGLSPRAGWITEAQRELKSEGFIIGPDHLGHDETAVGKITAAGLRAIESRYGSKDGVGQILAPVEPGYLLTEDGGKLLMEDGSGILLETSSSQPDATPIDYALPVGDSEPQAGTAPQFLSSELDAPIQSSVATMHDSAGWTGTQFILVDAQAIDDMRRMAGELRDAVYALRIENNFESSNLKGLVDALVSVCNMAEPETTVIDRILASPKFKAYAGILAMIATIRGAFGF